MAADAWVLTETARGKFTDGTFQIGTDSFKVALFLSTSNIGPASTTYAGLTNEHANANGYTTGGVAVTVTQSGLTTVTIDWSTDPSWTASGGDITARWAVLYEVSGDVVAYALLDNTPADVTVASGDDLVVAAHASGLFTVS